MSRVLESPTATCLALLLALALAPACGGDDDGSTQDDGDDPGDTDGSEDDGGDDDDGGSDELPPTVFVAREGSLVSFDIATGDERPGTVTDVTGPVDMQALAGGFLMVNLTGRNEILVVDGLTMLEEARLPSSAGGGKRPVHSFLTPDYGGARYWMTLNDGEGALAENSACLVDVAPDSPTRFEMVGEFALGVGHHKAAFSATLPRVVVSNISDCSNVMTVYDFSNPAGAQSLITLTAANAGFPAPDPGEGEFDPTFCDPTFERGLPPAPHGCATSPMSGKVYCNITSSGDMVAVDIDSKEPTFALIPTEGSGGGYTFAHPDGQHMYTLQEFPREGDGGVTCQIGAINVLDSSLDQVVTSAPLGYTGPDCEDVLTGTPAATANAGHAYFADGGDLLLIPTSGGFDVADARVDRLLVVDTSDPAAPVQLPSLQVGFHTSHSAAAMSGDGSTMFVVNGVDGTLSQVDVASRAVTATVDVGDDPRVVATFGTEEGPGYQTGPVE
jgi:YVTN family beta-propeller protein